jgi:glycosyltransferase involved in cell wall biosynthesis
MGSLPLISIVTPSYNQARYLEDAMRSVLEQDYPLLEYFVVDGGSTDGSVEIIRRLADEYQPRLKWWVSEKDLGQADAINKGFRNAGGEIIAWLNSDDLYLEDALKKAARFFSEDPGLGMLYSDVISVNEREDIINIMRYRQWGLADLMAFNIIGQPGVFMRRSALEGAGFLDIGYHMLLDHHLWLRIASRQKISHLDDCLAAARFHAQAKNVAQAEKFSQEAFRLLEWMRTSNEMADAFQSNKKKIIAGAHSFSGRYLLDAGLHKKAVRDYFQCLKHNPATALKSIHRFLYALFSLILPLKGIKRLFLAFKKNRTVYNGLGVLKKWWNRKKNESA